MKPTIKAYYKAVTTTKDYIIQEDISTNFFCMKYTATNKLPSDETLNDYNTTVIPTEYYYENLDVLKHLFDELSQQWTKDCYYYQWEDFLKRYDLSDNQYMKIKSLLK